MMRWTTSFAMSLVASLCACGDEVPGAGWGGSLDTLPNGAIRVSNPEAGRWSAESAWMVEREFRIGSLDVEGPTLFGNIGSLTVDDLGRTYVLETNAQVIRVFDRSGEFVRQFGRRGAGPGELQRGMTMLFHPEGSLWVLDPGNGRVSVFDTTGQYVDNMRMRGGFFTSRWKGGFGVDGHFYSYEPSEEPRAFAFVLMQRNMAFDRLREIAIPRFDGEDYSYSTPDGQSHNRAPVPFTSQIVWRFDPRGYLWFTETGRYRVYQRSLMGDTLRVVERVFSSVPVTRADRDSVVETLSWFTRIGGHVDVSRIPETRPAIRSFVVDGDGYLWVFPITATRQNEFADVFDPDGRYLGRLDLGVHVAEDPQPIIHRNRIVALSEGEFGEDYVVSLRLVGR